jgi:hypothetical protein
MQQIRTLLHAQALEVQLHLQTANHGPWPDRLRGPEKLVLRPSARWFIG